ncbi:MAG TPA: EAL domain-containing protein [Candidatus Baltobacteraceae bacterium]|nr:EAL domain-containing protein [Candidatus Baltobacteraceae bacterium]
MYTDSGAPRGEQAAALVLCALLCVATAIVLSMPQDARYVVPTFPFVAIATAWSIFDLLTACFLFARLYVNGRALFGWIGAAYGCSGLLALAYIAAYLHLLDPGRNTLADQQIAGTLYIIWHSLFAILIAAGLVLYRVRPAEVRKQQAPGVVTSVIAGVVIFSALIVAALLLFRDRLPILAVNGVMEPPLSHAMQFLVALSAASLVTSLVACRRQLYGLPLWVLVALLTSMLEAALNSVSQHLFSIAWDVGKLLTLATSSFVMSQTLVTTFRMYASVSDLMALRSRDAGERLRAIWLIATSDWQDERDHLQLVLDLAAANIRPRNNVFGFTSQLENGTFHINAVSRYGDPSVHRQAASVYREGASRPAGDGIHAALLASGKTLMWQTPSEMPGNLARTTAWRSAIGTTIQVGTQTHFLVFGTPDNLDGERLGESDAAFIEVLSSIISRRYSETLHLERIEYHSERDSLTGAYNRTLFRRLGRDAAARGTLRAIMLINLDRFAEVNFRLGQAAGDNVLMETAGSLIGVDANNAVARISGDEFAVLLRDTNADSHVLPEALAAYEQLFKGMLPVTASVGVAVADGSPREFDAMLSQAAVALDNAKSRGGDAMTVFGPDLQAAHDERIVERAELIEALNTNALFLEYQPTFALNSGAITGAEALVRWNHPQRGILAPNTFLPAMRRANLLSELTLWVMQHVARDVAGMQLPPDFRCFFNVPSQVLENAAFIANLEQLLFSNPNLRGRLGIEVTESEVMHKVEHAIDSLTRVRRLGLLVAVDDFGTGYSSLNYLKRLPVDVLKLDKSFIQGLPHDSKDVALAELFLALSRQFGVKSVGEGIETEAQAAWLRSHGCEIGQGFLYAMPLAKTELADLLAKSAEQSSNMT